MPSPRSIHLQNPLSLRTTTTSFQSAIGHQPFLARRPTSGIPPARSCFRAALSTRVTSTILPATMNPTTSTSRQAESRRHSNTKHVAPQFPTHFLALPLVNVDSLPQLARSIAQFQRTSTAPRALRPSELRRREMAGTLTEKDGVGDGGVGNGDGVARGRNDVNGAAEGEGEGERFRIIPEKAQRPAGTLHLTLGTMVLKEPEDFARALEVLRGIDYGLLLNEVVGATKAGNHQGSGAASTRRKAEQAGDAAPAEQRQTDLVDGHNGGDKSAMDAGEGGAMGLKTLNRPVSPPPRTTTATTRSRGKESRFSSRISISLRGLGTFPSPKKARVFYAVPHSHDNQLQVFAEAVQQRFLDAGLLKKEDRPLTLHATVANLKYSKVTWGKGRGQGHAGKRRPGMEVDARDLVERYVRGQREEEEGEGGGEGGEIVWAEDVLIDRVRICKMGAVPSEDAVMGLEYPAIWIPQEGKDGEEKQLAEVVFS